MRESDEKCYIFYDGVCNLCNWWVRFLLRFNQFKVFQFIPVSPEDRTAVLNEEQLFDSVLVYHASKYYRNSSAIFVLLAKLPWYFQGIMLFRIIPVKQLDAIYQWVSDNRLRWFGNKDKCPVPSEKQKASFLIFDPEMATIFQQGMNKNL